MNPSNDNADLGAFDVAIVGGGLAGQLCSLALKARAPSLSVALVEREVQLGGNHTWCCHRTDLALPGQDVTSMLAWFLPLVDVRWPHHRVRFPGFDRVLDGEYLCLRSATLGKTAHASLVRPGCAIFCGQAVASLDRHHVRLTSGKRISAHLVLDARGGVGMADPGCAGFQKFVGWEIELSRPSPALDSMPTLMDGAVQQTDGFRFVYTLPFSRTRVLVEDTYFSRGSDLDVNRIRQRLHAYITTRGMGDFQRVREESGVLPMPWEPTRRDSEDVATVGYRGGFFHPATGYSLGRAVVVAHRIAGLANSAPASAWSTSTRDLLQTMRSAWSTDDDFARWLNWLAFRVVPPSWLRSAVYSPVYRLPPTTLERFYAGQTELSDRIALSLAPAHIPFFRPNAKHLPLLGENP